MRLAHLTVNESRHRVVDHTSSPDAKIALFRALFHGREDVYPRRFENRRTGKAGYQPACGNEWVRGICEKPRIKCSECLHQRFHPVTDQTIRWHLSGSNDDGEHFVMGVYPMLQDETCFFLAVDFDKEGWRDDARAFCETCRQLNVPAALERSRSGNGAHIWIFFDGAISASLARPRSAIPRSLDTLPEDKRHIVGRHLDRLAQAESGGFTHALKLGNITHAPRWVTRL